MRILDNMSSLNVFTQLTRTNRDIERSTLRLSSGFRINTAGDDPAGFSISVGLNWQVNSMNMANRNTLDASSLLETADAALQDIQNMVHRIRELAVQAANDTNVLENRLNIQDEVDALLAEIDSITQRIEFNNIRLLNGEANDIFVQVGGRQGMTIPLNIPSFQIDNLFVDSNGDPLRTHADPNNPNWPLTVFPNSEDASAVIEFADEAIHLISRQRSHIGANVNRMEYTSSSLMSSVEATSRSLSRILDTDMALEMMNLSTANILSQAGIAIMAQANQRPMQLLQLIQ